MKEKETVQMLIWLWFMFMFEIWYTSLLFLLLINILIIYRQQTWPCSGHFWHCVMLKTILFVVLSQGTMLWMAPCHLRHCVIWLHISEVAVATCSSERLVFAFGLDGTILWMAPCLSWHYAIRGTMSFSGPFSLLFSPKALCCGWHLALPEHPVFQEHFVMDD